MKFAKLYPLDCPKCTIGELQLRRAIFDNAKCKEIGRNREYAHRRNGFTTGPKTDLFKADACKLAADDTSRRSVASHQFTKMMSSCKLASTYLLLFARAAIAGIAMRHGDSSDDPGTSLMRFAVSGTRYHCNWTSARWPLMLGPARNVDGACSREAADQSTDRRPRVAR